MTIKEISTEISLTRPAIYNYFETKEEILLGLLAREYRLWCEELEGLIPLAGGFTRRELAREMAHTLADKATLLRILNMNLYEIEQNSRIERLAEFKKLYQRALNAMSRLLRSYKTEITDSQCAEFCETFCAYLFGVYPFAFHSQKQLDAMKLAGVTVKETSICDMVCRCLVRLIPDKQKSEEFNL